MFSEDDSDGILLVDVDNAFNRINRNVMLHSIRIICPIIATNVINSYSQEATLLISGGEEITSAECTTQDDPTAMPVYAIGSLPLLNITITDAAYADNISCVEKLRNILTWWDKLNIFGPKIRYFPVANKQWLILQAKKVNEIVKRIFKDTNLNITNKGKRHLGEVVGMEELRKEYVIMRVNELVTKLKLQTKIYKFYPQAAYCAFISGFSQKFNYII